MSTKEMDIIRTIADAESDLLRARINAYNIECHSSPYDAEYATSAISALEAAQKKVDATLQALRAVRAGADTKEES